MKRTTLLSLMTIVIAGFMLIGLNSCETKESCEKNNFGTVIVTNNTGQVIWVDCTQEGSNTNDERMLGIGQSTQYQMKPGQVTEWATPTADYQAGNNWYTDTYYLDQCETHDEPWITTKRKSTKNLEKWGLEVEYLPKR